jgi:hypothetical protein
VRASSVELGLPIWPWRGRVDLIIVRHGSSPPSTSTSTPVGRPRSYDAPALIRRPRFSRIPPPPMDLVLCALSAFAPACWTEGLTILAVRASGPKDGYAWWVRASAVTKELAFWQKHSPNYDLYRSSILSTSQIYDGCVRCEGYNEPKSGEKNFERIRSL